jgi:N-acetyl sugar amidotransferase
MNQPNLLSDTPAKTVHQRCSRCVLDSTATDIWFDDKGICKYCYISDELEKQHPLARIDEELKVLVEKIKQAGQGKRYDCIVGVSGGRDSSYTLLIAKQLGLRPLAVHFDNGWNSDIAVQNIRNAVTKLDVDLHTVVADWEEFKDLQRAFLTASVPDADIPTDYAIYSVLYETAAKEGVKYILNGHSFRTEGTSPISWTYMDGLYFKDVHRKLGSGIIRSFRVLMLPTLLYYSFIKRLREVRILEYVDYNKKKVDSILSKELGWVYYGGHHHENLYTKFFQSYLLPAKFNIDKRKTELSALIRSGQITRVDAVAELEASHYEHDPKVVDYAITKLGWTQAEWDVIFNAPRRTFNDFRTYLPLIKLLRLPIKIACKLKILPHILYLKYAS